MMFSKINVRHIITDHIKTLRSGNSDKISISDIILFFGIPLATAFATLFIVKYKLDDGFANALTTSFSVFSALLFNLLLLIYDILRKETKDKKDSVLRRKFLMEIYANISFGIFISVTTIVFLLLLFFDLKQEWLVNTINFIVYSLVANFILTMLMVLKRVHILLSQEMKE